MLSLDRLQLVTVCGVAACFPISSVHSTEMDSQGISIHVRLPALLRRAPSRMPSLLSHAPAHLPRNSEFQRNIHIEQPKSKLLRENYPFLNKRLHRRLLLEFTGFLSPILFATPLSAAPMPEMKEPEVLRTIKLADGVRLQDIVEGKGPEAREGDLVEVNYVCRRSNGYFVHSTVDQFNGDSMPIILPLDENKIIKGLKEVLIGMKVGGKRRALIPASVGYINETLEPIPNEFGPRRSLFSHANEPLIFEVQLLKVL